VPGDVLMALAQFAGQTVAAAAITDVWEAVRGRFARLIGRGDVGKTEVAGQWLTQTHDQLTAATGLALEQAQHAQAERWAGRFADLLDEDPGLEAERRTLADEVAALLPVAAVSIGAEWHFSRLSRQALGQLEARHPDPVTSNRRTWSVVCDGPHRRAWQRRCA